MPTRTRSIDLSAKRAASSTCSCLCLVAVVVLCRTTLAFAGDSPAATTTPPVSLTEGSAGISDAHAETTPARSAIVPKPCVGFHPERQVWGYSWLSGMFRTPMSEAYCPPNHAFYAADDASQEPVPPYLLAFLANCCPLPADDILTSTHHPAATSCPPDSVVTGLIAERSTRPTRYLFRCTAINTERYLLGPETSGVYWGTGSGMLWIFSLRGIKRSDIPAAIRPGVGREFSTSWDVDGCVGQPFGSLITARVSGTCEGLRFRRLQFTGAPGDPEAGTPVPMFPKCRRLGSVFELEPECIE